MRLKLIPVFLCLLIFTSPAVYSQNQTSTQSQISKSYFTDAAEFGFSPEASGVENVKALQKALDQQGTVIVSKQGTYKIASTVFIGSNTTLIFGDNVFLKKVAEEGDFTHVILNKGALTKTYDEHITVEGMHVIVNGVDKSFTQIYGLRGQLAFFYAKDVLIKRFRCMDLGTAQFCIHVCTFEDLIIDDAIIKGKKDGVHLGRGKRFSISNCVFQTYDDAIALNAHDYATSNPELGWIENGIIQNCHDLEQDKRIGYFCRILAGGWIDWKEGMEVQQSDAVVSNGRIYRVQAQPDGQVFKSVTKPTHNEGSQILDGIKWGVVQTDITYTAGVRNVVFRDIFLKKPRIGFSVHFDNNRYSRSYYPGAEIPKQEQLVFDNVKILHDEKVEFLSIGTPVDVLTITNCSFRNNKINFRGNNAMPDYLPTKLNIYGCVFRKAGEMELVTNTVKGKKVEVKTSANIELHDDFKAVINAGEGEIIVKSDLPVVLSNESPNSSLK